jgi:soluble lytic murein transglycosylase
MVLALSRQESEFNPLAVSPADARGLMQLIPRYAQAEARKIGMPFRASWLTDDPTYTLKIGRAFLDDLVDQYDGSYIMAAAAYNAGPSRVRTWVNDYGDPRGAADPVQWIESIPFSETRNYVQRVLENTEVYRSRLTGKPVRLTLSDDLHRGKPGYVPDSEPLPELSTATGASTGADAAAETETDAPLPDPDRQTPSPLDEPEGQPEVNR